MRRSNNVSKKYIRTDRSGLLLVVFFVIALVISVRLFHIQIVRHIYYKAMASGQHEIDGELAQSRGEIFMHNFKRDDLAPLVVNRRLSLLFAVPREVVDSERTAEKLVDILEETDGVCDQLLDSSASSELIEKCEMRKKLKEDILKKISKANDPYEPLRHRVEEDKVAKIRALALPGIYFKDEWIRFYPEGEVAGQITGFLGFKGNQRVGQYGIEGYFEEALAGEKGSFRGDKDLRGQFIPAAENKLVEAKNGVDVVLTLDKVIQSKVYKILAEAVQDYKAESGVVIVMDPRNGSIKAMVDYPSFDPNNYAQVESIDVYRNKAVAEAYEPGSVFKVITMAAGLDSGAVKADDSYYDEGFVKIGKYKIQNADNKKYGEATMTEILEKSINSGAIYVARKTGKEKFRDYVKSFGFGQKHKVGLSGEVSGDISSLEKAGDIYLATASYGQGITVTPLEMVVAVSTIVNNGRLVTPKIVDYMKDSGGNSFGIYQDNPKQVIKAKTAEIIKAMMVSVVKNGHGKKAGIPGYYIGGKTGTAEVAKGGKYGNENIHSFVGFGPLEDTRFVIMVKLVDPKWGRFSAVTAAPTFAKVAGFLLRYYEIAPEYEIDSN